MNDHQHFHDFVSDGSQTAFGHLVDEYCGLVFGTALRLTGNRQLAEEVAQDVFARLAAKASTIRHPGKLGAWLHRTTVLTASNAIKKEIKRRRAMNQLLERTENECASEQRSAWHEALPYIDDAMNRLNRSDRQALMLRFYEGRTHREVGQLIGKSEDGVRKQISRALAKVSRFMTQRGVTIPSVVLGSGLASILTEIALGDSVARISTGAFASKATVAGSISACLAGLLGSHPGLVTVLGIIVLCATTAGGYLSGSIPIRPTHLQTSSSILENVQPQPDERTDQIENNPFERNLSRRDLLLLLDRAEADANMRFLAIRGGSDARASAYLRAIPNGQVETALELVANDTGGHAHHPDLTRMLISRWAMFDGKKAIEYAQSHLNGNRLDVAVHGAVQKWANVEPFAAWDWVMSSESVNQERLSKEVFSAWANQDVHGAVGAALEILDSEVQQGAVLGILRSNASEQLIEYVEPLLELMPDAAKRGEAVSSLIHAWARRQPVEAASWVASLQSGSDDRREAENALVSQWIEIDGPAAADWVMAHAPEDYRWTLSDLVRKWQWRDPYELGEWLAKQPLTEKADEAVVKYATYLAKKGKDPDRGVSWARTVHSKEKQLQALSQIFRQWHEDAPDAADAFINANEWSEDELQAITEAR